MSDAPSKASARPEVSSDGARAEQLTEFAQAFRHVFVSLRRLRGRDTHLCAGELSHAQFELLIELHERGELPVGELAVAAQLTPATVTQMLDHLASSGRVERVRMEGDRRVVLARLTDSGRSEIQAKREAKRARWEQALADVDAEELRVATRVLESLSSVFEET